MRSKPNAPTPAEATALQRKLASNILFQPLPKARRGLLVAGADCSYQKIATSGYAAIVVCRWPDLEVVEIGRGVGEVSFPYTPGLLSFRELPLLNEAWEDLKDKPDFVVVDGQGIAHPRRFGLAAHAGLVWETPTIGCAKTLLIGEHGTLRDKRGARAALKDKGERIGTALRTREGVKPVFVSPGHLCDFESSAAWVLRLAKKYRLPEVIRLAHAEVNRMRKLQESAHSAAIERKESCQSSITIPRN